MFPSTHRSFSISFALFDRSNFITILSCVLVFFTNLSTTIKKLLHKMSYNLEKCEMLLTWSKSLTSDDLENLEIVN